MAFFRNYSNETVSQSFLEDQNQGPHAETIHRSAGNLDADVMSCDKEFDMNMDVKYQSEDKHDGANNRLQNEAAADEVAGAGVSNSQSSGRRTTVAGKWGSTFWKDCQPMCPQGGSDSGQDTKSGSEYRNAVGSEDNSSDIRADRFDSEDDGRPKVRKGQRGHSDIPADEMLSDEYYEQDGEEQSDSMHYRGFHHSVGSTSRLQSKPTPVTNHTLRTSRLSNNNGNYDDGEDDNDNIDAADADYEEEDEDGNFLCYQNIASDKEFGCLIIQYLSS